MGQSSRTFQVSTELKILVKGKIEVYSLIKHRNIHFSHLTRTIGKLQKAFLLLSNNILNTKSQRSKQLETNFSIPHKIILKIDLFNRPREHSIGSIPE